MAKRKGGILMATGLLLLAAALFLACFNLYTERRAGAAARAVAEKLVPEQSGRGAAEDVAAGTAREELPDYALYPEKEMPVVEVDGVSYVGVLEIPSLELTLPVMDEWSYEGLKTAPGRYQGSAYLNDLIILAHNYSSHFGGLKNLRGGDAVRFTDTEGNAFDYVVAELETLEGTDVERMAQGDWDLTLFTCTVGGVYRVTVRCVLPKG